MNRESHIFKVGSYRRDKKQSQRLLSPEANWLPGFYFFCMTVTDNIVYAVNHFTHFKFSFADFMTANLVFPK